MKIECKKLKMSQIWKDEKVIPVTLVKIVSNLDEKEKLSEGELVKVSGMSKGKGFQGTVKRHGFHGGPKSHGQKDRLRAPGSIGDTNKQRVVLGKKMAGRTGNQRITVKNIKIIAIDLDKKILALKGALPGHPGTTIEIRR